MPSFAIGVSPTGTFGKTGQDLPPLDGTRAMRSRLILGLTLALATIALAPVAQAASTSSTLQSQLLSQTTLVRQAHDRAALTFSPCLDASADYWAKRLATSDSGKLVHRTSSSLKKVMRKCDLDGIGENLAAGQTSGVAVVGGPDDAVCSGSCATSWMKSSGHRKNQLGSSYRKIGVGAYKRSNGTWYYVALYGNPE